jgi:hypothetical protein
MSSILVYTIVKVERRRAEAISVKQVPGDVPRPLKMITQRSDLVFTSMFVPLHYHFMFLLKTIFFYPGDDGMLSLFDDLKQPQPSRLRLRLDHAASLAPARKRPTDATTKCE